MTVSTSTAKAGPYAGAGSVGPFTVNFRFLSNSHLQVVRTGTNGLDTTLTLGADYSVSGAGGASGSVTLTTALAVGEKLTIVRNVPFTQEADYVNNDAFPAESHETALDLLTMQSQQLLERVNASLSLPVSVSASVSAELPAPQSQMIIGWDEAGTALVNRSPSDLATVVVTGTSYTDIFTPTALQTQFVLTRDPGTVNALDVALYGVPQINGVDFTVSGTTLTMTTAPGLPPTAAHKLVVRYVAAVPVGTANSQDVTFTQSVVGAVVRSMQDKGRDVVDIRDFGITPDGVTDRTTAINTVTAALGAASYRGTLVIPAGTKFNTDTVYAAVPTGVMLDITDSVNWGQPPGYRNRFRMLYSSDLVNDDTQQIIASNHHPAMMLLNMGTAASVAASSRYGTILHGVGKDVDGDPMLGWFQQFAKHPSLNKWRISWRLNTPYNVAIANPTYWTSAQVVPAGAYRISDGGKVYQTTAGGTCGGTAPTGTGSGINDGGVLWNYVQAAIGIDSTRMDLDEDANSGFYGPSSVRMTFNGNGREHYFEVDPVSQDVVWRDNSRSTDLWRSSTANGLRTGRIQSLNRVNTTVSATGAITLLAPLHTLTASGGPWDITDLTLPAGQTSGTVTLWFLTANLTLKNNANIVTRTGADIASAASMMITLYKDTAISGSWVVLSKN